MTGRLLYEKYRKHEADALHWNCPPPEERGFWERLARAVAA